MLLVLRYMTVYMHVSACVCVCMYLCMYLLCRCGWVGWCCVARESNLPQGGAGSGSQFHWHESALNLQVFGRKRWFLFHPAMSSNNQQTTLEWLDSTYQQLPPQLKPVGGGGLTLE